VCPSIKTQSAHPAMSRISVACRIGSEDDGAYIYFTRDRDAIQHGIACGTEQHMTQYQDHHHPSVEAMPDGERVETDQSFEEGQYSSGQHGREMCAHHDSSPPLTPKQAFGRVLQQLRREHGVSQEQLGFEAGFHRTYISMLERGQKSPSLSAIFQPAVAIRHRRHRAAIISRS
jgi:DNA-binding XRE family transcriptional regulator